MMTQIYMDYSNPKLSGQRAFLRGKRRDENPCGYRTHANARDQWDIGWVKQSKITCVGIQLNGPRDVTGCTQTGGDCPSCGK